MFELRCASFACLATSEMSALLHIAVLDGRSGSQGTRKLRKAEEKRRPGEEGRQELVRVG
eukprot:767521-Hanusia_phi.AAC.3